MLAPPASTVLKLGLCGWIDTAAQPFRIPCVRRPLQYPFTVGFFAEAEPMNAGVVNESGIGVFDAGFSVYVNVWPPPGGEPAR